MLERNGLNIVRRVVNQTWYAISGIVQNPIEEQQLVQRALDLFREKHPKWVDSCFDMYFLTHEGKEALVSKSAEGLARAYLAQLPFVDNVKKLDNFENTKQVAADFLNILALESQRKALSSKLVTITQ